MNTILLIEVTVSISDRLFWIWQVKHGKTKAITIDPEDDKTKVLLQPSDTIAISFTDITTQDINEANTSHQHSSMSLPRVKERLKLDDDCISAFSQSETLDEANPW